MKLSVFQNVILDLADDIGDEPGIVVVRQSIFEIDKSGGIDKKE